MADRVAVTWVRFPSPAPLSRQAEATSAKSSQITLENRTALRRARHWPALADAGVALTGSGGGSRFQRARLRHGSRRSRPGTIGQKQTVSSAARRIGD